MSKSITAKKSPKPTPAPKPAGGKTPPSSKKKRSR